MAEKLLLHMDHFSTFPDTDDLDKYVKRYQEEWGFVISDTIIDHVPGLKSRFVSLTGEFIELSIVANREIFTESEKSCPDFIEAENEHRPYNIGFVVNNGDIDDMYIHWRDRGFQVEDVQLLAPEGIPQEEAELDPYWAYIPFPSTYAKGANTYVIEYKKRTDKERFKFVMGENNIYGVNGVTLVTHYPQIRAEDWSNFFYAKNNYVAYLNECTMELSPHFLQWITPQKFEMIYKVKAVESKANLGDIYLIHLLSKDIKATKEFFEKKGKKVEERVLRIGNKKIESILIERNPLDGFFFAVSERDPNEWLEWRKSVTGEVYK